MAALSAVTRGAAQVMVVDRHPDRLRLAEQVGAIPVDDSRVERLMRVHGIVGVHRWRRGGVTRRDLQATPNADLVERRFLKPSREISSGAATSSATRRC